MTVIGYLCQAVILLAGCGFFVIVVLAVRREASMPEAPIALHLELTATQPIDMVLGAHLAPHRVASTRRVPAARRRPPVRA